MARPKLKPITLHKSTLKQMLKFLDPIELDTNDIKGLILSFVAELSSDTEDSAAKSRVKLDSLRLLLDVVKSEDSTGMSEELLKILQTEETDDE